VEESRVHSACVRTNDGHGEISELQLAVGVANLDNQSGKNDSNLGSKMESMGE
jgi:hypothetical protein